MKTKFLFLFAFALYTLSGSPAVRKNQFSETSFKTSPKVIHVFVALCDNKYQGIVPVPAKIGNGQDPDNNLYWGCGYGIRTYFKKSSKWKLLKSEKLNGNVLERIIFKHSSEDVYLVADAYDGKKIKTCTEDFLKSNSGELKSTITVDKKSIGVFGNASLVAYIGHNGLMDFQLTETYSNTDGKKRDCIILACKSQKYFSNYIKNSESNPLVWTTQFMAPEAYTLHDALNGYVANENASQIHQRASKAYSKYQKCSVKAASKLLVTGF